MKKIQTLKHQGIGSLVLIVMLSIFGIVSVAVGVNSQQQPPSITTNNSGSGNVATNKTESGVAPLGASEPKILRVPALDLVSDISKVAKNEDGSVEVPKGSNYNTAAWYKFSPTPGEAGSSVILGHVDSVESGPSVFFNLGKLKPGDEVMVERADGNTAVFSVDRIQQFPRNAFPTSEVYGNIVEGSTLKLVTCGGEFDNNNGEYKDNIVVFASLVASN